ncbi:type 1 glutamine amidotransferase [Halalkalibaculum sp. DA3122]|uniref:type 1 glutamine amidotransferase n=1 Tax=Halalkalibaculum sp. DA3122 TaxID=3373607 RepID=UPI0037547DE3
MKIHYLQHVPFEGPGYISSWAKEQGHDLSGTRLFEQEALPEPEEVDLLVVMGGPMGVNDEQDHPWLEEEKMFIENCISHQKNVLGICLGAQFIANAMGAKVEPMPEKEIGWFPVRWSRPARKHPLLNFLPEEQVVLHWHGDRFDIPDNGLPIASSEGCENQGFLLDERILGLQFHLEMTQDGLAALIENSRTELAEADGRFLQDVQTMLDEDYFAENHQTMRELLNRFLK